MTPDKIRESVLAERIQWIREMCALVRALPLDSFQTFIADKRNIAAAESYLRRMLEALMDIGRHILDKGFGTDVVEYKSIAIKLCEKQVISETISKKMLVLAEYRSRIVHYYIEISDEELNSICSTQLSDIEIVLNKIIRWIEKNPDKIDKL